METALFFVTLGAMLLVGLALDALGRAVRLPRITLLVLFGAAIGPAGFALLPQGGDGWREPISIFALAMIAFLLGGELSRSALRAHGRAILAVSLSVTAVSFAVVAGGLLALGAPLALALLLAGVGLATDPAATRDVVREARADGPVSKTLLGVVAIDDAWGVVAFSLLLGLVTAGASEAAGTAGLAAGVSAGLWEVGVSIALGLAIGLPAAALTGRIRRGEPTLVEALGVVLLIAGVSLWADASPLLAGMTAGVVVVNLARHHDYPFHEIEHLSWPFLIVFFVLAGATVDPGAAAAAGALGAGYVVFRVMGRVAGGWIGGRLGGMRPREARYMGLTLFPQAGVALGMALAAGAAAPLYAETLIAIAVATTVLFELLGPIATRLALLRLGETGGEGDAPAEEWEERGGGI
ncbi:MAG: cation:proton antiporter [Marivibrio sp.]|uniref:cation:proton antiporter n=1 Tax=Marivibrio sp. TaxID=2039719 RepID=UPI0032EBF6FC